MASYAPICLTSPFACFGDLPSQNDLKSSSKDGVLSSSIDETLGKLKSLFLGVEQDGSSTCMSKAIQAVSKEIENCHG